MQHQGVTPLRRAVIEMFARAPNLQFAEAVGRPRGTVRSWMSGYRRPPIEILRAVAALLRSRACLCQSLAAEIEHIARVREAQPPVKRGFLVVKPRDGQGSVPRNARWTGRRSW